MKNIRLFLWFISGILSRYYKIILLSFSIGLIVVVTGINLGPYLLTLVKRDHKVIGLVGNFTPSDLPLSIQRLLSSGLTDIDETGDILPALAASWSISEEGTLYTFRLRENIFWHDESPFVASDVNYNLKDVVFTPIDKHTLNVKLKNPFAPLPTFLAKPIFKKGLIGLGSYKINTIRFKGESISMLKITSPAKDLPVIEFKFYPSETVAKTAFKLGEVDLLDEIINPVPFTETQNIRVKEVVKFNWYVGIFYNMEDKFLNEKSVRQALTFAVDKPEKNRVATPLSLKSWAYTNRVKQFDKDIEQSKKLISKFISSESAVLTISTFNQNVQLAQVVASAWNAIGVTTKVKVENSFPENYQVLIATQEIPSDPDQYLMWHSTQIGTNTNISRYNSQKVDKLLEDGRKEIDRENRQKIYADFQRYLVDDAPAAFLYHPTTYTISR